MTVGFLTWAWGSAEDKSGHFPEICPIQWSKVDQKYFTLCLDFTHFKHLNGTTQQQTTRNHTNKSSTLYIRSQTISLNYFDLSCTLCYNPKCGVLRVSMPRKRLWWLSRFFIFRNISVGRTALNARENNSGFSEVGSYVGCFAHLSYECYEKFWKICEMCLRCGQKRSKLLLTFFNTWSLHVVRIRVSSPIRRQEALALLAPMRY